MNYIIIGVGAAGITAASTIRKLDSDASITMISKDENVHSRCMLHKYLSHERDEKELSFIDSNFFTINNIKWIKGCSVININTKDRILELDSGNTFPFDKLLIATGAESFIPPIGNFKEAKNVFGLRHLSDAQQIRKIADKVSKIVIVGSGLVGMDAAYAFLEQNKDVTIVEMMDRILPVQLNETAGNTYKRVFEEHGCKFLTGKKVVDTHMDKSENVDEILLDDDTRLKCDLVLVAAGVRAAVECLNNTSINIERSIQVSDTMETSCQDIYAAGDVTGLSGIWPNAMKQGEVAAYNMCQRTMHYTDTYAMKNTMNFYGITTLSLGKGVVETGDEVVECEDSMNYKRAIIRDNKLDSIILQGDISYSGIYQYLIKNQIDIGEMKSDIFKLSFAEFYSIRENGEYAYNI